jgi:NAD(P)-dependent dehydrogenase (short-subunit alcohol dehydrogenase family)
VAVHCQKNRAAAEIVLGELPGTGHALFAASLDRGSEVSRLWSEVTAAFGRVDIVVNNAAIYDDHPPLSTRYDEWQEAWQRTIAANLLGPANLCHLAANAMATDADPFDPAHGRGRIVNISSRGAFRGEPNAPAYGASKAGLNSLSQSLARVLGPQGVYLYCLAPGWVETDMSAPYLAGPRRRLLRPGCARRHDRLHHRRERGELPAHLTPSSRRVISAAQKTTPPGPPCPHGAAMRPRRARRAPSSPARPQNY